MQITSKPFKQLNECHFKAWARLQHGGREYDSPFFSPGYTSAVASVRDDIWVGIMQHADRIVGLLPPLPTKARFNRILSLEPVNSNRRVSLKRCSEQSPY